MPQGRPREAQQQMQPRPRIRGQGLPTASVSSPIAFTHGDSVPSSGVHRIGVTLRRCASTDACRRAMLTVLAASVRHDERVGTWTRLMEWDKRVSRKLGLRFDDPAKTPQENIRLAQRRRKYWLRPPIVAEESDFLTTDEAKRLLRSRFAPRPSVNMLIARGILQHCFAEDGREGITRSSVEEEVEWRRTAGRWKKLTRRLGGVLHWV